MSELTFSITPGIVTVKLNGETLGNVVDGMFVLHEDSKIPRETIEQVESAIISIWEYLE